MLKISPVRLAKPLAIIFNKSLEEGKYPSSWKVAYVTAFYKKGDASLPSNYRPISLISCVGKVMERVVYKHVYNHMVRNKLFYEFQSGFLPKHSTIHQLLELYNSILNSLENKDISCFVFADFSKAFDKVWHVGLIHKMNAYGVRGNLLNWFKDYLHERKQKVVNKNYSSTLTNLYAGVPQGSVLGPLLFLIYINDIGENLRSLTRLFADDTSLGYSSQNKIDIENVINNDLNQLNIWSEKWLMSFNPDKTEIMVFSKSEDPEEFRFFFDGNEIKTTSSHKHLGVTLTDDAKWNEHTDNIIKSARKHLGALRKLKYKMNRQTLSKMYITYIRPILEYACEVWDNCNNYNINKLEKVQLDAARIVTGLPIFTKTENLYLATGWEPLEERRHNRKLQLLYNIKNGSAPQYLRELLPPTIQSITTYPLRNGNDFIVPFCRLTISSTSFFPSTIREWNKLDESVQNLDTLSKFKNAIRKNTTTNSVPKHYLYGDRKLNITLTQIRCSASFLNYDLCRVNIIQSALCSCGARQEDAQHFFFNCHKYSEIRKNMLQNLSYLSVPVDLDLLTKGDLDLSYVQNCNIFKEVHKYIKLSKRFLIT